MAVTYKELINLIKLTMIDCPLPSIADMLCAIGPGDDEATTMFAFIKSHYTREQIRAGIDEYQERIDLVNSIFGDGYDNQE